MPDLPCGHDERFHLMGAKNGCCACEAEAARAEFDRLQDELISENVANGSLLGECSTLRHKIERLQAVVQAQGELLVAYRLHRQPSGKCLDTLAKLKAAEAGRKK